MLITKGLCNQNLQILFFRCNFTTRNIITNVKKEHIYSSRGLVIDHIQ
jgi:hypothetical protein